MIGRSSTDARHALFDGLIDDAALFPPRQATMEVAFREHLSNRSRPYAFLQGTFVVPARRVGELLAARHDDSDVLQLSLVVDFADLPASIDEVTRALDEAGANIGVRTAEVRLPGAEVPVEELHRACDALFALNGDGTLRIYFESARMTASSEEPALLAAALATLRKATPALVAAKLRCGGVTADAVPAPEQVARFILAMRDRGLPWKATAGLHHPLRGVHGDQTMHGFVNVLAAALAARGRALPDERLVQVLNDGEGAVFRLSETGFAWRDITFGAGDIAAARREAFHSYGSCSFDEPVEGLCELGMLA